MSAPPIDALILAGGAMPAELEGAGAAERALLDIAGSTMLARVLGALRATPGIGRIAVAGSPTVLRAAAAVTEVVPFEGQPRMVENLRGGVGALYPGATGHARVLVCTCDIPLAGPATFSELLDAAAARDLEAAYPIVRRTISEAAFPDGKRTYAKLREGEFTGGNAVLIPVRALDQITHLVETAYNARKQPAALVKMLGGSLMLKFATRRLAIADVERRAATLLNCRVGAVEMGDAAIAFDVDKLSDLQLVRQRLES